MSPSGRTRVTWITDRDAGANPFIGIGVATLKARGCDVLVIDGAEVESRLKAQPKNQPNALHPYSRARRMARFDATIRAADSVQGAGLVRRILRSALYRLAALRRDTIDLWTTYVKGFAALWVNAGDVLIASRPTVLLAAWIVARLKGRRLVYQPFELYGEQKALYSKTVLAWERFVLRRGVDALVTQNDARAKVYAARGHAGPMEIVHNYKPHRDIAGSGSLRARLGLPAQKRIVLYEGGLMPGRWLDRLAQASLALPDDAIMVFMGPAKRWWVDNHAAFTAEPVARGKLIIAAPIPHAELIEAIADADVGVIVYDDSTLNNRCCEPGKLSDYVFARLPVVAPDFPSLTPTITRLGIGETFADASPEGIAAAIGAALEGGKARWRSALDAAAPQVSWETQAARFASAVLGDAALKTRTASVAPVPTDILILVEHADRELDVACLLASLIRGKNPAFRVEVANFYTEAQSLTAGRAPRVVALPFAYGADDPVLRDYVAAWPGARFFNLAWEQILYDTQKVLKRPRDAFVRERVRHLAWSETFADYLLAHGVRLENIATLGHPLFDLYTAENRAYFLSREELAARHGFDPKKRWVLFPENYRWAFFSDEKLALLETQGARRADLEANRAYCHEALAAATRWLAALARGGQCEAILRPRPAVSTRALRAFIEAESGAPPAGFHILKDHSFREWALASDLVVSSFSTSLIEAAVAGKPVLRVAPVPQPESLRYEWGDLAPAVETEAAFLAAATGPLDPAASAPLKAWAETAFKVGAHPTAALADALIALASTAEHAAAPAKPARAWIERSVAALPPRWAHRVRRRFQPGYVFNPETHEKDLFGAGEVRRRMARWRDVLARA